MSDLVSRLVEVFTKTGRWGRVDNDPTPPDDAEVEALLAGMSRIIDNNELSTIQISGLLMSTEGGTKEVYVYAGTYEGETTDA